MALAGFLQHRDSSAILDAALARLERLRASLSGEGETRMLDPGIAQRIENECRFGIEEALHTWPDSRRAKAALTDLARLVVERALRAGDWRAAAATMTRLSGGDDALWQRYYDVNILSGVRLARAYMPAMLRQDWGRVVFIASESALNIPADMIHYGMSKTALLGLARGLAKRDMRLNDATPFIEVDPETYEVRADGALLTCEPAAELPLAQRYFLY